MVVESATRAQREARRFFKFLLVGALGFVIDTGSLSMLVLVLGCQRQLAKALAFSFAVLSNFVWNRLWIYRESRNKPVLPQVAQFLLISLVGLGINVLVFGAVDKLARERVSGVVSLYVAQVCAVGVALIWNFGANRLITYGDIDLGR